MEMDRIRTKQTKTVQDIPPVPIKTYKWEDIRREKKKGRYPYTYLHKEPYNDEIDPSEFKMDTMRSSKSASTLEKSSSGVDIQEIVDDGNKSSNNGKHYLSVNTPNEGIVETADSSNEDNISQYLDKDDDPPTITEHIDVPGPSKRENEEEKEDEGVEKMETDNDAQSPRAKSEEPKRKRKLSIESSYSRISLSRLGVMKKLREAKEKIKLPKFSFSKSESKLDIPKKNKKEGKKSDSKDTKKPTRLEQKKDETPVYIHIPLKPPPGQTDEFSYLEFEDRKETVNKKLTPPKEETTNDTESFEQKEKEGVQFIILTAPSDDERLDDRNSPSTNSTKKFFDNTKLEDLKSLAKGVDEISADMPIDGIIFEDVIQVEYLDEHNRPIGTTERSNFLEITEENLPKLEKRLSQRNLAKELEKEIASSMDSLHKIARQNTLKKLKDQQKARSIETLKKVGTESRVERETQEAPELTTPTFSFSCNDSKEKLDDSNKKTESGKEMKDEDSKLINEKSEIEESVLTPAAEPTENKAMFDEEDGLKLSETAIKTINEEAAKEKLPKAAEDTLKAKAGSIKKKVSFKRRSKQEDPDGIYEDVRVSGKKKDGNEQNAKEMKVIEAAKSMSVEEEKTYLDDKIIKSTSLEEDYNKWTKLTDHEYEPVNPPAESEIQQPQKEVASAPVKRSESNQSRASRHSKKSPANSIRIPLKDEDIVPSDEEMNSGDGLTAEDLQERIENQFFNNAPAAMQDMDTSATSTTIPTNSSKESAPQDSRAKKIQDAFKTQAENLRTKMKNIKKPNIHMPQRPNLERFKIQKPNINIPKIPDQMRVNLPSFTLPKKSASAKKRSIKERQFSTESNVGDSKKKLFDFSTYPRIFGRKKKPDNTDDFESSATVPRAKISKKKTTQNSGKAKENEKKKRSPDVIRIPLHSKESMDKEDLDLSSHGRYGDDIDMDDEYLKESQQMHIASEFNNDFSRNRWNHGSFHGHNLNEIADNDNEVKVTDLDNETDPPQTSPEPELERELTEPEIRQTDTRVISSTGDIHRQGVLEKINSDEYFIREKGISQDNIQMGELLSAEIREAFKQPINSLAKIENDSFDRDFEVSDQSIQEVPKRRPLKKPKRKKTPNVSKERIPYDPESEPEEYPQPFEHLSQPPRPKRRSKQKKKPKDDKPPYQETILVQNNQGVPNENFDVIRKAISDNILLSDRIEDKSQFHNGHFQQEYPQLYENERMQGIEQPNILVSDPYYREELHMMDDTNENSYNKSFPEVPPRKQRSMKSLASEHDSIIDEYNLINQNLPQQNVEAYRIEHEYIIPTPEEPPVRPERTRSRTRSESRATEQPEEDQTPIIPERPCVEEPCIEQTVDYMGYAVIDKNTKCREPPLPPPTRRKKPSTSAKSETKFFTVPRQVKDVPVRPIRNYSTLVPKSQRSTSNLEEEKENIDIGQYIEIDDDEDDHTRLQSGDIVRKMKDRPLPAPPRPPRKTKDTEKDIPLKDIAQLDNIDAIEATMEKFEEAEASVQTEPLPDDFVCEEFVQEKGDRTITPTLSKGHITEFENIETVTHGALVVAPVPHDFQEGPITNFSRSTEKIITIRKEVDNEEVTSDPPESFKTLKDPQPQITEKVVALTPEIDVLKAQKLQVSDLDVDRLMVNELLASKIKVSEIDGDSISIAEINPKSGNIVIGGLELPANFLQDIMEKITKAHSSGESHPSQQQELLQKQQSETPVESTKEEYKLSSEDKMKEVSPKEENKIFSKTVEKELDELPKEEQKSVSIEKTDEPLLIEEHASPVNILDPMPMKSEEIESEATDNLDLKKEQTNHDFSEQKYPEVEEELSPTAIKATIDYLDNLIKENTPLNLEELEDNNLLPREDVTIQDSQVSTTEPGDKPAVAGKQASVEEKSESTEIEEVPPLIPDTSEEERLIEELRSSSPEQKKTPFEQHIVEPPKRPPRQSDIQKLQQSHEEIFIPSQIIENSQNLILGDITPPPRPPDPEERLYLRSQPPPSFYALQSPAFEDFIDDDIPLPPRRKRPPRPPSRSSSEEVPPTTSRSRRHRTPEPSIPQLTGQLTRACMTAGEKALKRLIKHITTNVLRNADGRQDLHVVILILLVLIAGLILLGDGGVIVHHHHWEYFNPPKDL